MKDLVPTLKPDAIYAAMKRTAIGWGTDDAAEADGSAGTLHDADYEVF
jgi:predicted hydrolase (HD superfamily)